MIGAHAAASRTSGREWFICLAAAVAVGAIVARADPMIAVGALVATLYATLFIWSPAVALLAYVVTRPVVEPAVLQPVGPLTLGQAWGAGLLLSLVAFLLLTPISSYRREPLPLSALALVILYGFLSMRGDTAIAVQNGFKLTGWILLIVAIERIARTRSGQLACFRVGYGLAVGTAILIAYLVSANKYGAAHYTALGAGLEGGIQQDPQALSFLALFSTVFPLVALLMRWSPLPSLVLVGVLSAEIVISYVRTALVALSVMLLVFLFVAVRRRRPTAFVLAGCMLATLYAVQDRIAERFADLSLLTSGDAAGAGSNRVAIWSSVWDSATASLPAAVIGSGAGTSYRASDQVIGALVDAHNDVLELFATGGLVLVGVYALFMWWVIRSTWHVYRDNHQSSSARAVAALALGTIAAFFTVAFLTSISFYVAPLGFAVLIGLIRGMAATPSRTCFDPPSATLAGRS